MNKNEAIFAIMIVSFTPFIASFLMIICWVAYLIWFKKNPTISRDYVDLDKNTLECDLKEFAQKIGLSELEYQEMISLLPETGKPHSH